MEKLREKYKSKNLFYEGYYYCNAGLTNLLIDCEGNGFLCESVPAERFSLLENSFDFVWTELLKQRKQYIEIKTICSTCDENTYCGVCAPTLAKEYFGYNKYPVRECNFSRKLKQLLDESNIGNINP